MLFLPSLVRESDGFVHPSDSRTVWLWDGNLARPVERSLTKKATPKGGYVLVESAAPRCALSSEGAHLFWFDNSTKTPKKGDRTSNAVSLPAGLLQDPTADIGERSLVIQRLQSSDREQIAKLLDGTAPNENGDPLVLTILDLTRHSDRQLAFRAKALLAKLNVNQYIADRLTSSDSKTRILASRVLYRVDTETARQIIESAKLKGWNSPSMEKEIESGKKPECWCRHGFQRRKHAKAETGILSKQCGTLQTTRH
jgi:hypothetical protein